MSLPQELPRLSLAREGKTDRANVGGPGVRPRRALWRGGLDGLFDPLSQRFVRARERFVISDPDDMQAQFFFQGGLAAPVALVNVGDVVDGTVYLDGKAERGAVKIEHILPGGYLSKKPHSATSGAAYHLPYPILGERLPAPQLACRSVIARPL
jgi:hypothetical protein